MVTLSFKFLESLDAFFEAHLRLKERTFAQFLDKILSHCFQLLLADEVVMDLILKLGLIRNIQIENFRMSLFIFFDIHLNL